MKKTILFAVAAIISAASFAQPKTEAKQALKNDTIFVDVSKVKVIAFFDSTSKVPFKYVQALPLAQLDHLAMPKLYWWQLQDLLLSAKTGLSAKELETFYRPFAEYARQYEYALQMQEQMKQNPKQ